MQFFVDVTHCFANQDANIQAILIFCRSESNIFSQFSYCSCFVAQSRNVQSIFSKIHFSWSCEVTYMGNSTFATAARLSV